MIAYRFETRHALTGELLAQDLPLSGVEFGASLNATGTLSATLEPGFPHHTDVIDPGNTIITVTRDGAVLWGGLVWLTAPEGPALPLEAAGWGSYLHRRHDLHGNLGGRGPYVYADPCSVIRHAWEYAQEQPDSDLRVLVDSTVSGSTVGTPAEPYASQWWDAPSLGRIVDDMAAVDGGPEWTDETVLSNGRPHGRIRIGWPRLGRRRTDISFSTSVNITTAVPVERDADAYAQAVIALGAGEGRNRRRAIDAIRNGRLRLEHVLEAPAETATDRLAQRARGERMTRQILGEVTRIEVADHPAARLGSWQVGDDVRVQLHDTWADVDGWCRITSWTIRPPDENAPERVTLTLARADRFTYGGGS